MLISEGYRLLNAELHRREDRYGSYGKQHIANIKALCAALGTQDVLDYGCGKGTVAQLIGFPICNYDPAIPDLAERPQPADIVICTDVLEHIEPEYLDDVLDDLVRVTRRAIYLSVAQGPAEKILADGRNAHLIQKPLAWWQEKLDRRFHWRRVFPIAPSNFVYIGQAINDEKDMNDAPLNAIGPPPETTIIRSKSVYTPQQRSANIRSALLRDIPFASMLPPHDKLAVLACYGPSLKQTIGDLKAEVESGGDLWTVSGAHQFCIDNGVVPAGHIEADPRPVAAQRLGTPDKRVLYLCASACPPALFDKLHGFETQLFHVQSSDEETRLVRTMRPTEQVWTTGGGTNVGMAALALFAAFGYRRVAIHGMDCSHEAPQWLLDWPRDKAFPPAEEILKSIKLHAGSHPSPDTYVMRVCLDDRSFVTTGQLAQGVQDFMSLLSNNTLGIGYRLHGDGLLKNFVDYVRSGKHQVKSKAKVSHAENLHRVRSASAGGGDGADALGYAARLRSRLYGPARPAPTADQAARLN